MTRKLLFLTVGIGASLSGFGRAIERWGLRQLGHGSNQWTYGATSTATNSGQVKVRVRGDEHQVLPAHRLKPIGSSGSGKWLLTFTGGFADGLSMRDNKALPNQVIVYHGKSGTQVSQNYRLMHRDYRANVADYLVES